jgi:hypothetical protein
MDDFEDNLETKFGITSTRLEGRAFRDFFGPWHESFFGNVKRSTGKWVHRGIYWHAYSYSIEQAVCGKQALELYQAMPVEPYYLFYETRDTLLKCASECWPDLRVLEDDLYLVPCTLRWMFVVTHEMRAGLGPYFASPSDGWTI